MIWGWPQWTVASLQLFALLAIVVRNIKDTDISSERATLSILFWVAYIAAYCGVLHAGGFW